ncbi:NACHT domain-containing protein [Streptomyces longispororuber]|uniref:NACHT domain-containing protein n=1 Tax=Streptomyces longispororuber TaxID=68230 RepID=UPI003701BB67
MDEGRRCVTGPRWLLGSGLMALLAGCCWAAWSVRRHSALQPQDVAGVLGLPLGILGVLAGTAVSVGALRLQRATDARAVALDRLARAVQDVEVAERTHMLGTGAHLIDLPVEVTPRQGGTEPPGAQRLSGVADWYCAAPGRLVLTGEPGAGKTVLAVHLVVRLLATRAPTDPVPVRLAVRDLPPAHTRRRWWGRSRTVGGFEPWLRDSLVKAYEVPGAAAADLVARRLVIPVLDGLDEMDPDEAEPRRASRALAELNAYQSVDGSAPLVLTCRERRYEDLSARHAWLREATLLRIGGVDAEQARRYVALRSDGRASPMDAAVAAPADGAVAEALGSPFYLGLACEVYGAGAYGPDAHGTDAYGSDTHGAPAGAAPPLTARASAAEIREQLLARYVAAATGSANAAVRRARKSLTGDRTVWGRLREYEARRVQRWLRRMAVAEGQGELTLGRIVGRYVSSAASVVTTLSITAVALCTVPDAVRGWVPATWWVHREGLTGTASTTGAAAMAGAVASVTALGGASALYDATPPGSPDRVRRLRLNRWERLRRASASALSRSVLLASTVGVALLGAAARHSDGFAAVPQECWYGVGFVVALSWFVTFTVRQPFAAYTIRRGHIGCAVVPVVVAVVVWAAGRAHPWAAAASWGALAAVALVLWRTGAVPGFALLGVFPAGVVGMKPTAFVPADGFAAGVVTGLTAYYVLACVFLCPDAGPRLLHAIGRAWREAGWLHRPVRLGVAFLVGVGLEIMAGFATAVFLAVAFTATDLAGGLARGAATLTGAALGRVPPRLDAFLAWAYHAGLLRVVGGAYRFRHRELQEWLARDAH